LSALAH